MFVQQEFVEFLNNYKERLMESNDMLEESKTDYRVRKLAVFYALKDEETFNYFLNSKLGREYLRVAKYVLETIRNHDFYGDEEIKEISNSLLTKFFKSDINIKPLQNPPEMLEGYYKFLIDFPGRKRAEELEEELGEVNIDLDSLKFVS
jgi:hypothetical protein